MLTEAACEEAGKRLSPLSIAMAASMVNSVVCPCKRSLLSKDKELVGPQGSTARLTNAKDLVLKEDLDVDKNAGYGAICRLDYTSLLDPCASSTT